MSCGCGEGSGRTSARPGRTAASMRFDAGIGGLTPGGELGAAVGRAVRAVAARDCPWLLLLAAGLLITGIVLYAGGRK